MDEGVGRGKGKGGDWEVVDVGVGSRYEVGGVLREKLGRNWVCYGRVEKERSTIQGLMMHIERD